MRICASRCRVTCSECSSPVPAWSSRVRWLNENQKFKGSQEQGNLTRATEVRGRNARLRLRPPPRRPHHFSLPPPPVAPLLSHRVDTTTRTVFQDNFYKPKDGIAEYVADPLKGASAPRAQPHMPLSDLAPSDPRVRKLVSPSVSGLHARTQQGSPIIKWRGWGWGHGVGAGAGDGDDGSGGGSGREKRSQFMLAA